MNLLRTGLAALSFVLVATVTGCAASPAASSREPRSSILTEPRLEQSRSGNVAAATYGGASPRSERLRQ